MKFTLWNRLQIAFEVTTAGRSALRSHFPPSWQARWARHRPEAWLHGDHRQPVAWSRNSRRITREDQPIQSNVSAASHPKLPGVELER